MITVTDLVSYLYCPRKLYAKKRLGYKEPKTKEMVFGTIVHEMVEVVVRDEQDIIKSLKAVTPKSIRDAILSRLGRRFSQLVLKRKKALVQFGQNPMEVYKRARNIAEVFVDERAKKISSVLVGRGTVAEKLSRFSQNLVEREVSSEALNLRGRVDMIEVREREWIPIEYKTGAPPKERVWKGHQIQVAAYALLLENEDVVVQKAVVHYLSQNELREVVINPFMKLEVKKLVKKVTQLITQPHPPKGCGTCEVCKQFH
jgi:CRISPR-associated protein Cas4